LRIYFCLILIILEIFNCNGDKLIYIYIYRVIRNDCRGFNNLPPRSPDATLYDFFLWVYVKDQVYVPPLPASIPELKLGIVSSPLCVWKLGKLYVDQHNCVTWGVFNDYIMNNYVFRPLLTIFRFSQGHVRTTISISTPRARACL